MRYLVVALFAGCSFQHGIPSQSSDANEAEIDARGIDAAISIDAQPDAPPDATPAFDPTMCPAGYTNNTVTASPGSRYRVISSGANFTAHHGDCNDDHTGWTHLVTLDSALETQQIRAATGIIFYVGAVQQRTQATTATNWFLFDGSDVPSTLWQAGQPNDNGGTENNAQNFAASDTTEALLNDVSGSNSYGAVCECDGLAIPTNVAQMITDSAP